jgi:ferredoxin
MVEKLSPVGKKNGENKAVNFDPFLVDGDSLSEAAESCPEDAIIVEDDEGRQLYR